MLFWTSQLHVGGETLKQNHLKETNNGTNSHKEKIMQKYKERHSQLVMNCLREYLTTFNILKQITILSCTYSICNLHFLILSQ